jgi:hypothetical protein
LKRGWFRRAWPRRQDGREGGIIGVSKKGRIVQDREAVATFR